MVSFKTFLSALIIPVASSLPLVSRQASNCSGFDASQPFTLQTNVTWGDSSFNDFYLTSFHVGAGMSTVVGTKNSSLAVGWTLNDSSLEQPLSTSSSFGPPAYNITLLRQAPFMSNSPAGYDYVSLGLGESTPGFQISTIASEATVQYAANSSALAFNGFALCRVNGTAPYFGLGPQFQLLWKTANASTCYQTCADVNLVATNI